MFENLRRNCLIRAPKFDCSDIGRFIDDINRACHENVVEAHASEKRISEQYLKPFKRRLWKALREGVKRTMRSSHRERWPNDNPND